MAGPASQQTLARARQGYFAREGFPADGGYDVPWAEAAFAGLPYAVPNLRARAAALQVHDLHHVLTGYPTHWRAESEISAWELGSGGGGRYPYAWFIALFGLFVGLLALPFATFRAFARGRGSTNLYGTRSIQGWLPRSVDDARTRLRVRDSAAPARPLGWRGALAFAAWSLLAVGLGVLFVLGSPLLVVLGVAFRSGRALRRGGCGRCPLTRACAT